MSFLTLLSIAYSFQIGLSQHNVNLWQGEGYSQESFSNNLIDSRFDVKLKLCGFYIGGGSNVAAKAVSGSSFTPLKNTYNLSLGYSYKFITIGYEHYCTHSTGFPNFRDYNTTYMIEGMSDKIFVKFQHEFKPFR